MGTETLDSLAGPSDVRPLVCLDLGGGPRPLEGFLNVDISPDADLTHDFNSVPWPIDDASVDEVNSSHCIEHVDSYITFVREIARICRVGARVAISAPDPLSEGVFCGGHVHCFSPAIVRHFHEFPDIFWTGERKLVEVATVKRPDPHYFPIARNSPQFAGWSDQDILLWVPRTCHDNQFVFEVQDNVGSH